ncbi:MAG: Hpt domain-containing protein [Cyanobacteriota bacterium]
MSGMNFGQDDESSEEIKKLYALEAEEHLNNITGKLFDLEEGRETLLNTLTEIYRPIHSIKGDSNVLGFIEIGNTAHDLETYIQTIKSNPDDFNKEKLEELFLYIEKMRGLLKNYLTTPNNNDNTHSECSNIENTNEYEGMEEIRAIYAIEANEHINNITSVLLELESEKISLVDAITEIYRSAHSIKGDSNTLGFREIGAVAHDFESLMTKLKNNTETYNDSSLDSMFDYIEKIKELLNQNAENANNKKNNLNQVIEENKFFEKKEEFHEDLDDSMEEIKAIYAIEANEHINNITSVLLDLESNKISLVDAVAEIYRDAHSIKGDSNTLGFKKIGAIAHDFESLMTNLKNNPDSYNDNSLDAMFDYIEKIKELLNQNAENANNKKKNTSNQLIEEKEVFHPEMDDSMEEIKAIYAVEANEHINNITSVLLDLESQKISLVDAITEIYRAAHSIKGDSNTLGFREIGAVAHDFESLMTKLKNNPETHNDRSLDSMFEYVEKIKELLNQNSVNSNNKKTTQDELSLKNNSFELKKREVIEAEEADKSYDLNADEMKDIIDTFIIETEDNVNNITNQLLELESEKISFTDAILEVYRLAHSIKGDSNAVGLNDICDTAHDFESLMSKLQSNPDKYDSVSLDEMFNYTEKLKNLLYSYKNDGKTEENLDSSEEQDFSFKDGFASKDNLEQNDEMAEIKSLYSVETYDHINNITNLLLDLESGNKELELVLTQLYRATHSIKGDSNALGFKDIGDIADKFESFVGEIQKNESEYNTKALDQMFSFVEQIRESLDQKFSLTKSDKKKENITIEIKESVKEDVSKNFQNFSYEIKTENNIPSANDDILDLVTQRTTVINKNIRDYIDIQEKQKRTQKALKQEDETIRVSINKIDKLINLSGEMLISKISQDQHIIDLKDMISNFVNHLSYYKKNIMPLGNDMEKDKYELDPKFAISHLEHIEQIDQQMNSLLKSIKKDNSQFSFLVDELQYDSINTRMLPSSFLLEPMKITVRNTSKKLNKKIQFKVEGDQIEIDRFLIEKLKDPFGHIIRNAIDHGIESAEERSSSNKNEMAILSIHISISGNDVVFEVKDDGKGLDYENIKNKAIKVGLISKSKANTMNEDELKQLIFLPGFSTAEKITEISGRGVGLDVVNSMIQDLGGKISVQSEIGKGTTFKLSLPLTLSTFEAFLIKILNTPYVVAKSAVSKVLTLKNADILKRNGEDQIIVEDKNIRAIYLSEFISAGRRSSDKDKEYVALIIESGINTLALIVDDIYDSTKMYIKSLGSQLKKVKNISGATILGTGEPVLILNTLDIIKSIFQEYKAVNIFDEDVSLAIKDAKKAKRKVLVVDDSITTRTLEKNILELAGFEVFLAKNGLEGKEGVVKYNPDLIITDVEMPKMNGFEFTTWIKKESTYHKTPVIMITSLATEEFKQKGADAGVDSYIVKGQFDQKKLIDTIEQLI